MYQPLPQYKTQADVIDARVQEGTRANGKRTMSSSMAAELLALYAPPYRTLEHWAETVISEFKPSNGGNFRELAKRYGMTVVQIYKFIHARRPDLYARAVSGEKSPPAFDVSKLSTSAASTPFRTSHRTGGLANNPARWGNWKKSWCSRRSYLAQSPANTAVAPRIDCSARISGDTSGLSLTVSQANSPVLVMTFASDADNEGKHTSCQA